MPWNLISEHQGNQTSRPPQRDETNRRAEPCEPRDWLCLRTAFSVTSQPSAAAGFKTHPAFGLWIPSLPSRCQTFARPLGSCLLVPHLCSLFFRAHTGFWINRKPDATQTLVRVRWLLQPRPRSMIGIFLKVSVLLVSLLKEYLCSESNTLFISGLMQDCIIPPSDFRIRSSNHQKLNSRSHSHRTVETLNSSFLPVNNRHICVLLAAVSVQIAQNTAYLNL